MVVAFSASCCTWPNGPYCGSRPTTVPFQRCDAHALSTGNLCRVGAHGVLRYVEDTQGSLGAGRYVSKYDKEVRRRYRSSTGGTVLACVAQTGMRLRVRTGVGVCATHVMRVTTASQQYNSRLRPLVPPLVCGLVGARRHTGYYRMTR